MLLDEQFPLPHTFAQKQQCKLVMHWNLQNHKPKYSLPPPVDYLSFPVTVVEWTDTPWWERGGIFEWKETEWKQLLFILKILCPPAICPTQGITL